MFDFMKKKPDLPSKQQTELDALRAENVRLKNVIQYIEYEHKKIYDLIKAELQNNEKSV